MSYIQGEQIIEPFRDLDMGVTQAFDVDEGGLIGSECADCSRRVFPAASVCYKCRSADLRRYVISNTGVLYTYTRFHPGRDRAPYLIGYVDFEHDVRILGRLIEDWESPTCGANVRIEIQDGSRWVFAPAETTGK